MTWLVLLAFAACAKSPPAESADPPTADEAPADEAPGEDTVIETIDETTVGDLEGVSVPMANMTHDTYTLPDGTEAEGLICALVLPEGGPQFVGEGSVVDVEGTRWEVVAIDKPEGELGSVTLKKLE